MREIQERHAPSGLGASAGRPFCFPGPRTMHSFRAAKVSDSMEYRTKEEQVADYLREGIIAGRFPRGIRLKQLEIANLLQTSIPPVREALKLLAAEGYVVGDSYRGATVAPFDISASNEMLHLRILLDT